jgi:hypothetical protein
MIAFRVLGRSTEQPSLPQFRLRIHAEGYERPDADVLLFDAKSMAELWELIDNREDGGWGPLGRIVQWDEREWRTTAIEFIGFDGDYNHWNVTLDDGPYIFAIDLAPLERPIG